MKSIDLYILVFVLENFFYIYYYRPRLVCPTDNKITHFALAFTNNKSLVNQVLNFRSI